MIEKVFEIRDVGSLDGEGDDVHDLEKHVHPRHYRPPEQAQQGGQRYDTKRYQHDVACHHVVKTQADKQGFEDIPCLPLYISVEWMVGNQEYDPEEGKKQDAADMDKQQVFQPCPIIFHSDCVILKST